MHKAIFYIILLALLSITFIFYHASAKGSNAISISFSQDPYSTNIVEPTLAQPSSQCNINSGSSSSSGSASCAIAYTLTTPSTTPSVSLSSHQISTGLVTSPTNSVAKYNDKNVPYLITCPATPETNPTDNLYLYSGSASGATYTAGNGCLLSTQSFTTTITLPTSISWSNTQYASAVVGNLQFSNPGSLNIQNLGYSPMVDNAIGNAYGTKSYIFKGLPGYAQQDIWTWSAEFANLNNIPTNLQTSFSSSSYYSSGLNYQENVGSLSCKYTYQYQETTSLQSVSNGEIPFNEVIPNSYTTFQTPVLPYFTYNFIVSNPSLVTENDLNLSLSYDMFSPWTYYNAPNSLDPFPIDTPSQFFSNYNGVLIISNRSQNNFGLSISDLKRRISFINNIGSSIPPTFGGSSPQPGPSGSIQFQPGNLGGCSGTDPIATGNPTYDQYDCLIITAIDNLNNQNSPAYAVIDPKIIKAQIFQESSFNSQAVSSDTPCSGATSSTGDHSLGLMQITPCDFPAFAGWTNVNLQTAFNPQANIYYGIDNILAYNIQDAMNAYSGCSNEQYLFMGLAIYNGGLNAVTGCGQYASWSSYVSDIMSKYQILYGNTGPYSYNGPAIPLTNQIGNVISVSALPNDYIYVLNYSASQQTNYLFILKTIPKGAFNTSSDQPSTVTSANSLGNWNSNWNSYWSKVISQQNNTVYILSKTQVPCSGPNNLCAITTPNGLASTDESTFNAINMSVSFGGTVFLTGINSTLYCLGSGIKNCMSISPALMKISNTLTSTPIMSGPVNLGPTLTSSNLLHEGILTYHHLDSLPEIASSPTGGLVYAANPQLGYIFVFDGNTLNFQTNINLAYQAVNSASGQVEAILNISDYLYGGGLYNYSFNSGSSNVIQFDNNINSNPADYLDNFTYHHPLALSDINGYLYVLDDWAGSVANANPNCGSIPSPWCTFKGTYFNILMLRSLNSTGANTQINPTFFNDMFATSSCSALSSVQTTCLTSEPPSSACTPSSSCAWVPTGSTECSLGGALSPVPSTFSTSYACRSISNTKSSTYYSLASGSYYANQTYPPYGWVLSANITLGTITPPSGLGRVLHPYRHLLDTYASVTFCSSGCTYSPQDMPKTYYGSYYPIGPALDSIDSMSSQSTTTPNSHYQESSNVDSGFTALLYGVGFSVNFNNTMSLLIPNTVVTLPHAYVNSGNQYAELILAKFDIQNYTRIFDGGPYQCYTTDATPGACTNEPEIAKLSAPVYLENDPFRFIENIGSGTYFSFLNAFNSAFGGGQTATNSYPLNSNCANSVENGQSCTSPSGQSTSSSGISSNSLNMLNNLQNGGTTPKLSGITTAINSMISGYVLIPYSYTYSISQNYQWHLVSQPTAARSQVTEASSLPTCNIGQLAINCQGQQVCVCQSPDHVGLITSQGGASCPTGEYACFAPASHGGGGGGGGGPSCPASPAQSSTHTYTIYSDALLSGHSNSLKAGIDSGDSYIQFTNNKYYVPNLSDEGQIVSPYLLSTLLTNRDIGSVYINSTISEDSNQQILLNATRSLTYNIIQFSQGSYPGYETITSEPVGPYNGVTYSILKSPITSDIKTNFVFNKTLNSSAVTLFNFYKVLTKMDNIYLNILSNRYTSAYGTSNVLGYNRLIYALNDRFNNTIFVPMDLDIANITTINLSIATTVNTLNTNDTTLYLNGTAGYDTLAGNFVPLMGGTIYLYYDANINFAGFNPQSPTGATQSMLCAFGNTVIGGCTLANPSWLGLETYSNYQEYATAYNALGECAPSPDGLLAPRKYNCNIYGNDGQKNIPSSCPVSPQGNQQYCVPIFANGTGTCTSQIGLISSVTTNAIGAFSTKINACGSDYASIIARFYGSPSPQPTVAYQSSLPNSADPSLPPSHNNGFNVVSYIWAPNVTTQSVQIGSFELSSGNILIVPALAIMALAFLLSQRSKRVKRRKSV